MGPWQTQIPFTSQREGLSMSPPFQSFRTSGLNKNTATSAEAEFRDMRFVDILREVGFNDGIAIGPLLGADHLLLLGGTGIRVVGNSGTVF